MKLRLQPRESAQTCPFCRESVAEEVACPGCAARYHEPCAQELQRCGSLGCHRALRSKPSGMQEETKAFLLVVSVGSIGTIVSAMCVSGSLTLQTNGLGAIFLLFVGIPVLTIALWLATVASR